jgi:hypothetical protein
MPKGISSQDIERRKPSRKEIVKRIKEHVLSNLPGVLEDLNSQDPMERIHAIDRWAEYALENPDEGEVLKYLPKILKHLSDPNSDVMAACIDAWRSALEANPKNTTVLGEITTIAVKLEDPDDGVRRAALAAWEKAAKYNGEHPLIKQTEPTYRKAVHRD